MGIVWCNIGMDNSLQKQINIIPKIISVLSFVFLILFLRTFPSFGIKFYENNRSINYLIISDEIYFRQTFNNCGPYSAMGVINIVKNEIHDPEILAKETRWRIIKSLTFPQGVIDLLHKYKIKTKEYSLKLYSDNDKIYWLKNKIDNGNPIILLVKVKNIQHYLTVIGYDEKGFMLYDSLQEKQEENPRKTVTDRKEYAGNRYYANDELVELWNKGGYKIFFKNWAVVCYNKK
jgi:hypothetical protein